MAEDQMFASASGTGCENLPAEATSPRAPIPSLPAHSTTVSGLAAGDFTTPLEAADHDEGNDDEDDSIFGTETASSTASVSSSILEYRTIQGRTYHSEKHNTQYFTPNDDRQSESLDIV